MIRRAWEAVVLFLKEMLFALCVAVDGDDGYEQANDALPSGYRWADEHERAVAKARAHWIQWVERRAEARRDLVLIQHGAKPRETADDEARATRRFLHAEMMARAAQHAYDDLVIGNAVATR